MVILSAESSLAHMDLLPLLGGGQASEGLSKQVGYGNQQVLQFLERLSKLVCTSALTQLKAVLSEGYHLQRTQSRWFSRSCA